MPLNIYVFQLTSDHLFVYPSRRIDPTFKDLALEISLYYDFVKKYPPIRIIETLYDQTMMSVDTTVKKYMLFFEHIIVRGGTYHKEILPDHLKTSLKEELAFLSNIDLPNIDFIENLVLLKDRTPEEHAKLRTIFSDTLAQYRREKKIHDDLRNYHVGAESYIIDENVLLRIQEVKQGILEYPFRKGEGEAEAEAVAEAVAEGGDANGISHELLELYPTILIFLRRLLAIVLQYDSDILHRLDISAEELVYVKNPEFVLDLFFRGDNCPFWTPPKMTDRLVKLAVKICEYYETICMKTLNLIDESAFDVGLYEADFEWKYERAIYYMDWLTKHTSTPTREAELTWGNKSDSV